MSPLHAVPTPEEFERACQEQLKENLRALRGSAAVLGYGLYEIIPHTENGPGAMNSDAYFGTAGDFVFTVGDETEACREALLVAFLVAAGAMFGRSAYARAERTRHYPVEFAALVGKSGSGRKGSAVNHVMSVLEDTEEGFTRNHVIGGLSSAEGLIQRVKPEKGADAEHDARWLARASELSALFGVMKREGNVISATVRQMFDGETLEVVTRKNPLRVEGANISIIASITQTELVNGLGMVEKANGFANRFLFPWTYRARCLPSGGEDVNLSDIVTRLRRALDAARSAGSVKRSPAANKLWAELYPILTRERDGLVGAICARAEAHVLRLSLIYALLDCTARETLEIQPAHIKAAYAVFDYCERSINFTYGTTTGDPESDRIVASMEGGPKSKNDLIDLFKRNKKSEWIQGKVNLLILTGKITPCVIKSDKGEIEGWKKVE